MLGILVLKRYIKKPLQFSEVTDDTSKKFSRQRTDFPSLKNYFSEEENQVSEEFGKNIQTKTYTPKELNQCFSADGKESLYMHLNISSFPYHYK